VSMSMPFIPFFFSLSFNMPFEWTKSDDMKVSFYASAITTIVSTYFGVGRHMSVLSQVEIVKAVKVGIRHRHTHTYAHIHTHTHTYTHIHTHTHTYTHWN
jgi:hypothetical protein